MPHSQPTAFSRLCANFTWTLNTIYYTGGLPYWEIQRYAKSTTIPPAYFMEYTAGWHNASFPSLSYSWCMTAIKPACHVQTVCLLSAGIGHLFLLLISPIALCLTKYTHSCLLLCFVLVYLIVTFWVIWCIYPFSSGLLHWHWGNYKIVQWQWSNPYKYMD